MKGEYEMNTDLLQRVRADDLGAFTEDALSWVSSPLSWWLVDILSRRPSLEIGPRCRRAVLLGICKEQGVSLRVILLVTTLKNVIRLDSYT